MVSWLRECAFCGAPSQPERCTYCRVTRGQIKSAAKASARGYRVEAELCDDPYRAGLWLRVVRYPNGSDHPDALLCADGSWWEFDGAAKVPVEIPPETGAARLPWSERTRQWLHDFTYGIGRRY